MSDGMPRAYLRIDPNIDQTIPDLDTFVRLLCAAARQPERGRFRELALVERAIGKAKAKAALARCDISVQPDGRIYVEGWDEWQEGDFTVAERMRRMRSRRKVKRHATVSPVTVPPSPRRNTVTLAPTLSVTTDAVEVLTREEIALQATATAGESRASDDQPEMAVLTEMARLGATVPPNGNKFHQRIVLLVQRHGAERVITEMRALHAAGSVTDRQLVFGAENVLDPISGASRNGKAPGGHTRTAQEVDNAFKL